MLTDAAEILDNEVAGTTAAVSTDATTRVSARPAGAGSTGAPAGTMVFADASAERRPERTCRDAGASSPAAGVAAGAADCDADLGFRPRGRDAFGHARGQSDWLKD